ncbi:hypothetical protein Mapa_000689 [Marchantia paleacea]|nr:hypothetical protein Mapa_000689 [Marchantia paleacea]
MTFFLPVPPVLVLAVATLIATGPGLWLCMPPIVRVMEVTYLSHHILVHHMGF